jgi:hypothetical protein
VAIFRGMAHHNNKDDDREVSDGAVDNIEQVQVLDYFSVLVGRVANIVAEASKRGGSTVCDPRGNSPSHASPQS